MSQEMRDRAFDSFFTTKSAGHGLGLAVVSGIVRGLGGKIRLTSERDRGTAVEILLPAAETTEAKTLHPMAPATASVSHSQQAAVLVVEDEDLLRQAVAKMLRKIDFEVFEAANGSAAIDLLRKHCNDIDVILLDMTIPGASTNEVVAEAARTRPDIRVILTSAYSPQMLTPPVNSSLVQGFIRKPFQFGELVNTLRRAASA